MFAAFTLFHSRAAASSLRSAAIWMLKPASATGTGAGTEIDFAGASGAAGFGAEAGLDSATLTGGIAGGDGTSFCGVAILGDAATGVSACGISAVAVAAAVDSAVATFCAGTEAGSAD